MLRCLRQSCPVPGHWLLLALFAASTPGWSAGGESNASAPLFSPAQLFATPVGPRGLQYSAAALALDGRAVTLRGYRVVTSTEALPQPQAFLLAPVPLAAGDEDEEASDDYPPGLLLVECAQACPESRGPLTLTGTLQLGRFAAGPLRTVFARLRLADTPAIASPSTR